MSEQDRINSLEKRFNDYLKDVATRDIELYTAIATMSEALQSIKKDSKETNEVIKAIRSDFVQKNEVDGIIAREREKSNQTYILNKDAKIKWTECYEEHSDKKLDKLSKKIRIWGFVQTVVVGFVSFIVGMFIRSGLIVGGFIK